MHTLAVFIAAAFIVHTFQSDKLRRIVGKLALVFTRFFIDVGAILALETRLGAIIGRMSRRDLVRDIRVRTRIGILIIVTECLGDGCRDVGLGGGKVLSVADEGHIRESAGCWLCLFFRDINLKNQFYFLYILFCTITNIHKLLGCSIICY